MRLKPSEELLPCFPVINCQREDCGNMKKNESPINFYGNIWQYSMHEEKSLYSDFLTGLLYGSWIICQRVWRQNTGYALNHSKNEYISQHLLIICLHFLLASHYFEGKLAPRNNSLDIAGGPETDNGYI